MLPIALAAAISALPLLASPPAFPAAAGNDACSEAGEEEPGSIFYVDPVKGSQDGDGSLSSPFRDINALLDPKKGFLETSINTSGRDGFAPEPVNPSGTIKSGATIMLLSGNYGKLDISNVYNDRFLTIRAAPGAEAVFSEIAVRAGRRFVFDGLTIRHVEADRMAAPLKAMLFHARSGSLGPVSDIVLQNASLATVADSSRFTDEDWKNLNTDGVNLLDVDCVRILNNRISNIRRGISNGARHATVSANTITNFSGDGIRFMASHQVYENNIIRDSRNTAIDPDHPDGMQGFAYETRKKLKDAAATDITISGNLIEDPIRPGYDPIQGISYFDGIFSNVAIFNNLVVTNSFHGISAYGGENITIAYNTVVSPAIGDDGYTTIRLARSKTGKMPAGAVVLNNVADRIEVAPGVVAAGNALLRTRHAKHSLGSLVLSSDLKTWFIDPATGDFTPRSGSPLVNAAITEGFRVLTDIRGKSRDARPDIGAFEF